MALSEPRSACRISNHRISVATLYADKSKACCIAALALPLGYPKVRKPVPATGISAPLLASKVRLASLVVGSVKVIGPAAGDVGKRLPAKLRPVMLIDCMLMSST